MKTTDTRVTAQPIHESRLEKFRGEIEDPAQWVTGPLDRREAAALCGDALHWREVAESALDVCRLLIAVNESDGPHTVHGEPGLDDGHAHDRILVIAYRVSEAAKSKREGGGS